MSARRLHDAITDVEGVLVGHATLTEGSARTGVTVVVPPELPCFAGWHRLNGNGELTGTAWIDEAGLLTTPTLWVFVIPIGPVRSPASRIHSRPVSSPLPLRRCDPA